MDGKEIAVREQRDDALAMATPSEQVAMMTEWARVLMAVVEEKKLYATIEGKKYLEAEAWEIILSFAGVGPQTEWVRPVEESSEIVGYEAKVNLVKHGEIVGGAIMSCGLMEFPCRGKEGQAKAKAAKSAAQTWAMSKAARLKFALVPVLAGYAPTPAEEVLSESASDEDSEHFCPEHNTAWFKKGKMRNYAHPIGNTGEWCNMPKTESAAGGPQASQSVPGAVPSPAAPTEFKDTGSVLTWALDYGLSRTQVLAIPGVDGDLKGGAYSQAQAKIAAHMVAKKAT